MSETKDRGKELGEQHWKYIESLLRIHGVDEEEIKRTGFHYKQAMKHGYKHGVQEK